ncbi:MAG: hypothetical protein QOJ27_471, partial [Sphingomonadales bacterium]|nr:hypothetical protein [Sphingomonadales bacterium]
SPADGQEHEGILVVAGDASAKLREGGEVAVYAHRRKPLVVIPAEGR